MIHKKVILIFGVAWMFFLFGLHTSIQPCCICDGVYQYDENTYMLADVNLGKVYAVNESRGIMMYSAQKDMRLMSSGTKDGVEVTIFGTKENNRTYENVCIRCRRKLKKMEPDYSYVVCDLVSGEMHGLYHDGSGDDEKVTYSVENARITIRISDGG